MKRKWYGLLIMALCCVVTSSCKFSNSPESVAKRFLISFNRMDFVTAKSLSTKQTWDVLDIMAAATKNISQKRKDAFAQNFTVEILNVKHESDSSVVVTFKTNPKRLPFDQLRLFKQVSQFGKVHWKVDISTLDLLNSEQKQDNQPSGTNVLHSDSLSAN